MVRKLSDIVRTPAFERAVDRARAKLDAEEAGWFVMEPKRARALLAVARAAERRQWYGEDFQGRVACIFCNGARTDGHFPKCALARLERVSKPRSGGEG